MKYTLTEKPFPPRVAAALLCKTIGHFERMFAEREIGGREILCAHYEMSMLVLGGTPKFGERNPEYTELHFDNDFETNPLYTEEYHARAPATLPNNVAKLLNGIKTPGLAPFIAILFVNKGFITTEK